MYAYLPICLFLCVLLASSSASANYCGTSGGDENTCPETYGSYHNISVRTVSGTVVDLSGDDSYVVGTTGGLVIACRNGTTLHFLYDETLGNYLYSGLAGDSAICWGAGNDTIVVARSSFQCNSVWYGAMSSSDYHGHVFHMHGQAGKDYLGGGDGSDKLCGGTGNDQLLGFGGNDDLDGLSGDDLLQGGSGNDELWGYTGADCLKDESGTDYLNAEGGFDACVWDVDNSFSTLTCDGGGGYTRNSSGTTSCTYSPAGCDLSCSFY